MSLGGIFNAKKLKGMNMSINMWWGCEVRALLALWLGLFLTCKEAMVRWGRETRELIKNVVEKGAAISIILCLNKQKTKLINDKTN